MNTKDWHSALRQQLKSIDLYDMLEEEIASIIETVEQSVPYSELSQSPAILTNIKEAIIAAYYDKNRRVYQAILGEQYQHAEHGSHLSHQRLFAHVNEKKQAELKRLIREKASKLDNSEIQQAIQVGRFYWQIAEPLLKNNNPIITYPETIPFIISRLVPNKLTKPEQIDRIADYLNKSYNKLSHEAIQRFRLLFNFTRNTKRLYPSFSSTGSGLENDPMNPGSDKAHVNEEEISTSDSTPLSPPLELEFDIDWYISKLFQAYHKRKDNTEFDLTFWSKPFSLIYDSITRIDDEAFHLKHPNKTKEEVIKKSAIKMLSSELACAKHSFHIFVCRAVDREIIYDMIEHELDDKLTLKEKLEIKRKIKESTVNEGLAKPLLMRSIIEDLKRHKPNRSNHLDHKEVEFDHLHKLLRTFGILRNAKEEQLKIQQLEELNQGLKTETDTIKNVKALRGFAKGIAAPNEIVSKVTGIIDHVNTLHTIASNTEKTVQSISKGSGLFSIIAGGLNLLLLPLKFIFIKKRWPNSLEEWGKVGASIALLTLGAVSITSVGGAIAGAGIFTAITCIGYIQAVFNANKTRRKMDRLREKKHQQKEALTETVRDINEYNYRINQIILKLENAIIKRPDKVDFATIQRLSGQHSSTDKSLPHLLDARSRLIEQYINQSATYLETRFKLRRAEAKHRNPAFQFTRHANVLAGTIAIMGAVSMFLFPPVGSALLIVSAVISGVTMFTEIGAHVYHDRAKNEINKRDIALDKDLIIDNPHSALFKAYELYPTSSSSHSLERNLMGEAVCKHQDVYEKKKALINKTPFQDLFVPKKPSPTIKKPEEPDEDKVFVSQTPTLSPKR